MGHASPGDRPARPLAEPPALENAGRAGTGPSGPPREATNGEVVAEAHGIRTEDAFLRNGGHAASGTLLLRNRAQMTPPASP